jgi:hypothetical protein
MTDREEADRPEDTDLADDDMSAFNLDGQKHYVRWHLALNGPDNVVATATGQWAFRDPQSCAASWPGWRSHFEDDEPEVIDLDEVTVWLRRQRLSVPAEGLLNAWNWADDVARGLELRWVDGGALADRCYDKLFGASLPWLVVGGSYTPRWNAREIDFLRRIGTQALTLVREGLRAQGR